MKHINESIIGRKGIHAPIIHARTGLQEGDIVYFKHDHKPYIVVLNPDIYKYYMYPRSIRQYDCSEGVFLSYPLGDGFMVISDYKDNLEYSEGPDWNIIEVKRRPGIAALGLRNLDVNPRDIEERFITVFKEGEWWRPYKPKRK